MKATLDDPHDRIRAFASQCVRDGVPTVNLEQLRMALTAADFVEAIFIVKIIEFIPKHVKTLQNLTENSISIEDSS